jgi:hypothetical protein
MKRRLSILPVVVICAVIAVPLTLGNDPLRWDQHPAAHASAVPPPRPADPVPAPAEPKPVAYPVSRAADPWKPGMPQFGIQIYWERSPTDPTSYVWGKAERAVDYAVRLNSNAITISFPFYTPGIDASRVGAHAATPTPADIGILIHEAVAAKLRVTVRPILDEASLDPPKGWRGNITPDSLSSWFASYQRFLEPYAKVAQQQKAATFVVGTELNSLEGDPRWPSLISGIAKDFSGEIGYDANWDNYLAKPIAVPVSQLGVDAYFPVRVPDGASVADLEAGWNTWLDQKSTGPLSDIIFSEVGIGAEDDVYGSPGDFYVHNDFNAQTQPTWYTAVCQVARQRQVGGIYFWDFDFDTDPSKPAAADQAPLEFSGHPLSEQAIRSCFAHPYTVPVPVPVPVSTP